MRAGIVAVSGGKAVAVSGGSKAVAANGIGTVEISDIGMPRDGDMRNNEVWNGEVQNKEAWNGDMESIRRNMELENENCLIMAAASMHLDMDLEREEFGFGTEADGELGTGTQKAGYEDVSEKVMPEKDMQINRGQVQEGSLWNDLPDEEIMVLQRIVEAEAGGEDADGKLLVANVVLNRVRDEAFPNSISEVVFQQSKGVTQFSPVANGRYEAVTVSEESKEAVERALSGEDLSEGALYFAARKYANPNNMRWFDENLTLLFQHGGHDFFK